MPPANDVDNVPHAGPGVDAVTDMEIRDRRSGRKLRVLRPGFVCRAFLDVGQASSKLKTVYSLGIAEHHLSNTKQVAHVKALLKTTEKQLRKRFQPS